MKSRDIEKLHLDALVLAGGGSSRMGVPKAFLPFGNSTLLGTVLDILNPLFRRVLVVARDKEGLQKLAAEVITDDSPQQGPLAGLARGLAASDAPWCFLVGCDMPYLRPEVIRRMAENLNGCDILALRLEDRVQPLHAFYSRWCLPKAQKLLGKKVTSLRSLLPLCQVRTMEASDFLDLDPGLHSLLDLDTLKDYNEAIRCLNKNR